MTSAAPVKVTNNLRSGATNISFPFYEDWDEARIQRYQNELANMKARGIRGVRITMSMNNFEATAKNGTLRAERWNRLIVFVKACIALGMTPIIDNHNTGLRGDDGVGDWESDYMGDLRSAAVRTRHINLMKAMAKKIQDDPELVNEVVFTPANEPIFSNSASDAAIWWNHQKQLIPAIRSVAPDVMVTYMANDWNGLESFVDNWNAQMKVFAAPNGVPDPRLFADVHYYETVEGFTHVGNANTKYPGPAKTWRSPGTLNWNKALHRSLLKPLSDFAVANKLPFVFISEYGTRKEADKESRLRYMQDLSDIFREFGWGHAAYTWSEGDSFKINGIDDRIWDAVTEPMGTTPPPDPDPEPEPEEPPVETDNLSAEERVDVIALINAAIAANNAVWQAKFDAANLRVTNLETRLAARGDAVAAAVRKFADEVDLT